MNILYLLNEIKFTDGVTTHLVNLTRGLKEYSSENIKLFLIAGGGNGLERFKNIDIKILTDKYFLHANKSYTTYLGALMSLIRFIKKNKINIVHSHSHYSTNLAHRANRFTNIGTVQTNHGLLQYQGRLDHFKADEYISVNEHIHKHLTINVLKDKSKAHLVRCGVPIPENIPPKKNDKLKIIAASRLVYDKGIDLFIKAVASLPDEIKQKCEFIIAGEGEHEKELIHINNTLNANVKFLGRVIDIYNLYASSDIFVFCSRTNTEGFPASITEAGANGCLVITSNFFGSDSIMKNKEDVLMFQLDSHESLASAITEAIQNTELRKKISHNFYKKVSDLFNLDTMIEKHLEIYKKCHA